MTNSLTVEAKVFSNTMIILMHVFVLERVSNESTAYWQFLVLFLVYRIE